MNNKLDNKDATNFNLKNQILLEKIDTFKNQLENEHITTLKSKEYIKVLESELIKYESIKNENIKLSEKNIKLNQDLSEVSSKYQKLLNKNKHMEKELYSLKNNNNSLKNEVSQLTEKNKLYENSRSWKLTKPLRSFKKFFN